MNHSMLRTAVLFAFLFSGCAILRGPPAPEIEPSAIQWPPPPQAPRVTWIDRFNSAQWLDEPTVFTRLLAAMIGPKPYTLFVKPFDVATDSHGTVYVTDSVTGLVWAFNKEQKKQWYVGDNSGAALRSAYGVAVDASDNVYVADAASSLVMEYGPDGRFVTSMGAGILLNPVGVSIAPVSGQIWVTDSKRHAVEVFAPDGSHIRTVGEPGTNDSGWNYPLHITHGPDDKVYVTDSMNFRVKVLDADGTFIRAWGENCQRTGCFFRAKGIGVDADGHVHVVDASFGNVQVFDAEGKLLLVYGSFGQGPGQLTLPAGLHIDEKNRIYAVSQYINRVDIFQYTPDGEAVDDTTVGPADDGATAPASGG